MLPPKVFVLQTAMVDLLVRVGVDDQIGSPQHNIQKSNIGEAHHAKHLEEFTLHYYAMMGDTNITIAKQT
jgi:hypothetical protein